MPIRSLETTCCIAGGGPAGIMLGYLLARAGVAVTVLEKHKDFFRDFRGDTVHPSTLEVMRELGLLEDLLKIPHQQLTSVGGMVGNFQFKAADFRHLPTHCKFVALMPQWDFLDFLSNRAKSFPTFRLRIEHEATALLPAGRVAVHTPDGPLEVRAGLVVACDGRHSTIRQAAKLEVLEFGVPIDVLWFRISRKADDPEEVLGNINYGKALVLINRGDYFQSGLIIPKGAFEKIQRDGLETLRNDIQKIAPYLGDRVRELENWDQIKLLTVRINRLKLWHLPGLLCLGDAAHAMSPAGGVGINLAIQDAVAAANILTEHLRAGIVPENVLACVQERREFPTRVTQFMQINAHKAFAKIFENSGLIRTPWQLKAAIHIPGLQRLLGRAVGLGARPEHIA